MFCAAPDCDDRVYCCGFCYAHYQRVKLGRTDKLAWGQTEHPFYFMWNDRKNANQLCERWIDFKIFIADIGERPSDMFRLTRPNKKELYGPTNFKWFKYVKQLPSETRNEFQVRRRQERAEEYKGFELKKNFNITLEQYNEILAKQNFVCAICEEKEKTVHHVTGRLKSLAVDHDHVTGKIRGLLCQRCNRVLGKVRDNTDLLDKMKEYINANS